MTSIQIYAFIILPIVVAALGWAAVLLNERLTRKSDHPAH
jgi:hypothetical protein